MGRRVVRLLLAAQGHHAPRRPGDQQRGAAADRHERQGSDLVERHVARRRRDRLELRREGSHETLRCPGEPKRTARTIASGTERITVPMGKVQTRGEGHAQRPARQTARRSWTSSSSVDKAHTNSWSFWSFPRNGLLDSAAAPVHSTVKWAGVSRLYPFVREGAPPDAERAPPDLRAGRRRAPAPARRRTGVADGRARPDIGAGRGRLLSGRRRRAGHRRPRSSRAAGLPARGVCGSAVLQPAGRRGAAAARPMGGRPRSDHRAASARRRAS